MCPINLDEASRFPVPVQAERIEMRTAK